jgi:hypothetical protein
MVVMPVAYETAYQIAKVVVHALNDQFFFQPYFYGKKLTVCIFENVAITARPRTDNF